MKKIIFTKLNLTLLLTLSLQVITAQLHIDKDFHIADNATVYVKGVQVTFSAASTTTTTTRTASIYGKLWMDAAASLAPVGASSPFPTNGHFVDGYVRSDRTTQFLYPVGQFGVLGIAATVGSNTNTIDVAYLRAAGSTVSTNYANNITGVSTVEHWDMIGTAPARVTLTWRSTSNLSAMGINNDSQIGIAAYNGSSWDLIPATIDATSILGGASNRTTTGSITTNANVNLSTYRYFTFAKIKEGCTALPAVANISTNTTWNGSAWSNGTPNENKVATIDGLYADSNPSFTCNSLVLNNDINLGSGKFVDCVYGVSGTGKIIMHTDANFLQRDASAAAPTINLLKVSPNKRINDWTYFGSPLANGEITAMATATATGVATPPFTSGAYYSYRIWNHGVDNTSANWVSATDVNVTPAKGFIARVKFAYPFFSPVTLKDIGIQLNGVTNNGDYTLTTSTSNDVDNKSTILVGNPYPSTIDADIFIKDNPNITGTLYFWSSKTEFVQANPGGTGFYTGADFVSYNLSGGTVSGSGASAPNKYIHSGQGFNVRTAVVSQPINFTNCMRVTSGTPTAFYRNANESDNSIEKDRFWLNISNANNEFFNQTLIGYLPETTLGYDRMYDGLSSSTSAYTLTSLLNNERYVIQSRSNFNATDVVPLHVKKASTYTGNMTISLSNKEGIFNTNDVTVFLRDKELNIFHNLEVSNYTFTLNELENSSRFEIVYQSTLNNPNFTSENINVSLFNDNFKVNAKDLISTISIFDISGRLIVTYKDVNTTNFESNFNHEDGIYIAKVVLQNGNTTSQKITNLNK